MVNRNFDLNKEPLWSIPQSVQERLQVGVEASDYRSFQLSGLYTLFAVVVLVVFGFYSATVGEAGNAAFLFAFAAAAGISYAVIWLVGCLWLAKHVISTLMALLCLYLFYSGGLQNTGPLFYFIFPSIAMFLHGRLRGFVWIIVLMVLTILMWLKSLKH